MSVVIWTLRRRGNLVATDLPLLLSRRPERTSSAIYTCNSTVSSRYLCTSRPSAFRNDNRPPQGPTKKPPTIQNIKKATDAKKSAERTNNQIVEAAKGAAKEVAPDDAPRQKKVAADIISVLGIAESSSVHTASRSIASEASGIQEHLQATQEAKGTPGTPTSSRTIKLKPTSGDTPEIQKPSVRQTLHPIDGLARSAAATARANTESLHVDDNEWSEAISAEAPLESSPSIRTRGVRRRGIHWRNEAEGPLQPIEVIPPLSSGEPLGLFDRRTLKGIDQSKFRLPLWGQLQKERIAKLESGAPKNGFDEMAMLTEQGKLWPYPIDNEWRFDECNVPFSEHVFLANRLNNMTFPSSGPIRHFMELVCTGLSKNPYMSVDKKVDMLNWYEQYFDAAKQERLANLQEQAAAEARKSTGLQPPIPEPSL